MNIRLPKRFVPVGAGMATLIVLGVIVGTAQFQAAGVTGPPAAASATATPGTTASPGPGATAAASDTGQPAGPQAGAPTAPAAPSAGQPVQGTAPTEQPPNPGQPSAEPTSNAVAPEPVAPPAAAPAPAPPAAGPPADAATVQRIKDSCGRRLQADAESSGVVAGPVVGTAFTLIGFEFLGAPSRPAPGSYDITMSVTTQVVNSPTQTGQRVCRVADNDSHVDWLPVG